MMVDHPLDLLGCMNFDDVEHCDGFVMDQGLAIKGAAQ